MSEGDTHQGEYRGNQHYIPKFLLRGFSNLINPEAKKKRRKYYCYVGSSSGGIQFLDTNEVASEADFHESTDYDPNFVENKLSDVESKHAKTLHKILREGKVHKSQWGVLSDLAFQLFVRTKSFREHTAQFATDFLYDISGSSPLSKGELDIQISKVLREEMRKNFGREPTAKEKYIFKHAARKEYGDVIFPSAQNAIRNMNWQDKVKNISNSILAEDRIQGGHRFTGFKWILHYSNEELILGDICVLAYDVRSNTFLLPIHAMKASFSWIVLPISNNAFILGFEEGKESTVTMPTAIALNENSIGLSNKFVVGKSEDLLVAVDLKNIGMSEALKLIPCY